MTKTNRIVAPRGAGSKVWVGVALLYWGLGVISEDLVDYPRQGAQFVPASWRRYPIAGWLGVGENLLQQLGADPVVALDLSFGDAFYQNLSADLGPSLHVGEHHFSVLPRRPRPAIKPSGAAEDGGG